MGAFLAGMVISNTASARETLGHLLSFRDALVALFFVTIGALVDPKTLVSNVPALLAILGMVVLGKFVIWAGVVRLFRYPFRTAISGEVYSAILAASLLSIVVNAFLVRSPGIWVVRREHLA